MNIDELFGNLRMHFDPPALPDTATADDFMRDFRKDLSGFSGDVYALAAKNLRTAKVYRKFFPTNGTIRAACLDARDELMTQAGRAKRNDARDDGAWRPERIALADRIIRSPLGVQAAEEGWIVHLHDWCRENKRVPNDFEKREVRRHGLEIAAERDRLAQAAEGSPNAMIIAASIGRAMESKRENLAMLARCA